MKKNINSLLFYILVVLSGYSCSYAMDAEKSSHDLNLDYFLSKNEIKGFESIVTLVNSKTIKLAVYGSVLLSSNFFWNAVAGIMVSSVSPFTSIAFYATNPTTAILVPLVLNPFLDYVIKPLPNNLIHKNWPNEARLLKKIFLKEYRRIASTKKMSSYSRFILNPEEYVEGNKETPVLLKNQNLIEIKKFNVTGIKLRLFHRMTNNPIASTIIALQFICTLYGMMCSIKAKSLDNRTKVFVTFCSLYSIITHLHELTSRTYFCREKLDANPTYI